MLKSHRSLCVAFSRTGAVLCIYHLFVWSNLNFVHISRWITLPTQSCLALYSRCANLLHSVIIWLMVSSLSPHSLLLLFCWVLCILALIWLVLMALSCAAIKRDSVSLLKFPFLSHVQVFSCEILFISRLYSFWVLVSMCQRCLQCWKVFFLPLFLKHILLLLLLLLLLLIFTPLEFFTSVLADGFSLEFEWQQVSSSLQDTSQYFGRPQQCCRLDSLYPSSNLQVLQAL